MSISPLSHSESESGQNMAELYPCTRCEVEVTDDVEALQCDLCSEWEHRGCIRECDRPSVELYSAIMRSPSKVILFVCSKCRRKGDVARRLFQLESASERANDRCQATERLLSERQALVEMLQVDKGALQKEISTLKGLIGELRRKVEVAQLIDESASLPPLLDEQWERENYEPRSKHPIEVERVTKVKRESSAASASQDQRRDASIQARMSQHEVEDSADSDSGTASDSSSPQTSDTDSKEVVRQGGGLTDSQAPLTKQQGNVFPYPPDFKQIQERVGRFTGKCGEEDFDVWLADFREATGDCKWTDKQRAQWFSWFLSGAAKSTWQRTLWKEEKKSWSDIVRVYKGHYGVHMEPRTAYLRCHELRYEDFLSVKGLLDSMKDY